MNNKQAQDLLEFQVKKDVSYLYKRFLNVIEDIRDEHMFMIEKLEKALPEEHHKLLAASNHFDENRFGYFRKKVLDAGNGSIRNLQEQISKFDVDFQQ